MSTTTLRKWHSYIGLFIAPSVIFFALTGAAQVFNLHEAHGSYQPPALVEKLSSVHKDQVYAFGGHHSQGEPPPGATQPVAAPAPPAEAGEGGDTRAVPTVLLKWFFLLVAVCLAVSTAFGIWMGVTQIRARGLAWLLLAVGTLVPIVLLLV